ncbi:MAG: GNAT family N-acetyltransferase [Chloroflexi bacterium]|nr:GNAT family N-acetyltransferase [Chloroflexota bacterium]
MTTGWNEEYQLTQTVFCTAIEKSWCTIAAYDDKRLVGFGRVVTDGLHAMIYEVIVDPIYQKRGVGTQLVTRLIDRCQMAQIRDIQLFCAPGKEPFYQKLGFVRRPQDAPGMDYRRNNG